LIVFLSNSFSELRGSAGHGSTLSGSVGIVHAGRAKLNLSYVLDSQARRSRDAARTSKAALVVLDPQHVELADQVAEDDRAVAGHGPVIAFPGTEDDAGHVARSDAASTGQGLFAVILIGKAVVFRAIEARTVTLWGKR
jgi:hypothetical protein